MRVLAGILGSVLATPVKFENASLFLRLDLLSTLIRQEKRSSNRRNLKTPDIRFCGDGKRFEKGGYRNDGVETIIM